MYTPGPIIIAKISTKKEVFEARLKTKNKYCIDAMDKQTKNVKMILFKDVFLLSSGFNLLSP